MLQARRDALDDALGIRLVPRDVRSERVQDEHLPPLRALVERGQQLVHVVRVELEDALRVPRGRVPDLRQRRHRVGHHHRVGVGEQLAQLVHEPAVLHELGVDVVQLRDANRRGLPHVRVLVRQCPLQRVAQVLRDLLHADAPHRAHGEGADQGIGVRGILHERVHGEDGELGLAPRVVEQVQVHQLLQLHVVGLRAVHHVGEEHGHVLADAHVGDDPLNRVLLHILVRGVDLLAPFRHLAPLVRREELGVASRHLDFARPARAAQQSTARERVPRAASPTRRGA